MLPEVAAELFAEKDEKKDRSVASRGLLYAVESAAFFLCDSDKSDECEVSLSERGRLAAVMVVDEGHADDSASEMSCRP